MKSTTLCLGLLTALGVKSQSFTTPYGLTNVNNTFHLYAFIGDGPYQISLAKIGNGVVMRADDYGSDDPRPPPRSPFTLSPAESSGFTLESKYAGKPYSSTVALYNEPVSFKAGTDGDGAFTVFAEYRPPSLLINDAYINVRLFATSQATGFGVEDPGALCTAKDGGFLVFGYGQTPGRNPGSPVKRPCYGATLRAFPGNVTPAAYSGP